MSVCRGFCKAQMQEETLPSLLRKYILYDLCLNSLKILFCRGLSLIQPQQGRQQRKVTVVAAFYPRCASAATSPAHISTQRVTSAVYILTGSQASGHNTNTQLRKPENLSLICMSFRKFSPFPRLPGCYLLPEGFRRGQRAKIVVQYREQIDDS